MMAPYWDSTGWMTKDEAEAFADQTLPKESKQRCLSTDDGFGCTLFHGHPGEHEAWGVGRTLCHTWKNRGKTHAH